MADARRISEFFLDVSTKNGNPISNMKLQKLLYYAQAWSLLRNDKPIFDDDIRAWKDGPVVPSVYNGYKKHGADPIPFCGDFDRGILDEEELMTLIEVINSYGGYSAFELRNMTHNPGTAWRAVYHGGAHFGIIPQELIRECYRSEKKTIQKSGPHLFSHIPTITQKDENGVTILPKEWADDGWDDADFAE